MSGSTPDGTDHPPTQLVAFADDLQKRLAVLVDPALQQLRIPFLLSLKPTLADYERVFVPAAVAKARAFYEAMWAGPMDPQFNPRHSVVRIHVAVPEDFVTGHPRATAFPQGYRRIVSSLVRSVPWACFELLETGDALGVSTDGLVRVDDRVLWFPRPYVALSEM